MKNIILLIVIALIALGIGWWYMGSSGGTSSQLVSRQGTIAKDQKLSMEMRKLWEDHILWTRLWIISEAYNTGGSDADAARLIKNQEDLGNIIKPYYGESAGEDLTTLLKIHITTAVELVKAAEVGNNAALTKANDAWYLNGNEIADFLASANPNWPQETLRSMMKEHLNLTKQEAVNILQKNYEDSVSDYDKVHEEILMMSDALTAGIIKQFPEKF